jgi:hypothetical protein
MASGIPDFTSSFVERLLRSPSRFESSKDGAIMGVEILPWHRHAMMLANPLPGGPADAVIILRSGERTCRTIFGRP